MLGQSSPAMSLVLAENSAKSHSGAVLCCPYQLSQVRDQSLSQAISHLRTACRSAGWPWGQFGVADETSPKKRKTTSHRKRSSSPATRTASHKSAAEAVSGEDVSKPPPKRAKRAAGIGAPKIVKRGPGRRGDTPSHTLNQTLHCFFGCCVSASVCNTQISSGHLECMCCACRQLLLHYCSSD